MSKSNRTHSFDIELASIIGVEKAIIVFNVDFWCTENELKGNPEYLYYGSYWTRESLTSLARKYPYMKRASISRWVNELSADGWLKMIQTKEGNIYQRGEKFKRWNAGLPIELTVSQNEIVNEVSQNEIVAMSQNETQGDVSKWDTNNIDSLNIDSLNINLPANAAEPEKENPTLPLKEKKKEKTGTPGPRRAAPKEAPLSHWQETIACFEDVHRQHFTAAGIWIGFDWSGKELKGLKELRGKMEKDICTKNGYEPDGPQINAALSRFFTEALKDDFTKNNWFTPSMLNARYQEIKQKIYAHANGTTAAKQRNATVQQQQHDLLATVIANRRY